MILDVTDLDVYCESLSLLEKIYDLTSKLPRSEYDLVLQLRRAAKSIAPNISEGFAKRSSEKEFKRFLAIALGSSDEVITHLREVTIVCKHLHAISQSLQDEYKYLSKRINALKTNWITRT